VGRIFVSSYLGTKNSSVETKSRADRIASEIGSHHLAVTIDDAYDEIVKILTKSTGKTPNYTLHGGSYTEDLALQNIQARLRMVVSYFMAQLVPWTKGDQGFLLVLSTSNIAEGLRGYLTKYDCSAGDLNPIGSINKSDIVKFLDYFSKKTGISVFGEIAKAKPTAELRPYDTTQKESSQLDEVEMGMTYAELDEFGRLRKIDRCGPVSMFE